MLATSLQGSTMCWTDMAMAQHHLHRKHLMKHISR
jgi:hypothetical protein